MPLNKGILSNHNNNYYCESQTLTLIYSNFHRVPLIRSEGWQVVCVYLSRCPEQGYSISPETAFLITVPGNALMQRTRKLEGTVVQCLSPVTSLSLAICLSDIQRADMMVPKPTGFSFSSNTLHVSALIGDIP